MRNNEKFFLYVSTVSIAVLALLSSFACYLIREANLSGLLFYGFVFVLFVVIFILSYSISKFILFRVFEKNAFLEILLKDTLHELNIPLSVIKANLQMLSLNDEDSKRVKKYKRIEAACDNLYKLYEDVDYYIKKEIKREIREEFVLDDIIKEEIDKLNIVYPDVKIEFIPTNLRVFCDRRGFSKAVGNLLSNALKYNRDNNSIDVYLDGMDLVIKDRGIGMSESELFMVFDRYYQGESKSSGFGIGLSIVKAFCDENRIFINIESKKDIGTKISLNLKNIIE